MSDRQPSTGPGAVATTWASRPRPGVGVRVVLSLLSAYQAAASGRISPCRFYPSCSEYAHGAIERYGAIKGLWLAGRRLGRCHPYHPGGYDPVP